MMAETQLTSTRVATILGVTPSTVKRWADEGTLPCIKTAGGHRRFNAKDVSSFQMRGQAEASENLAHLSATELDALPYGVIELDDTGIIQSYNKTESNFSGLPPDQVIGSNFFFDVAPCTNNSLVRGPFREGVEADSLDLKVNYTFTYVMRPTNVILHMKRCTATQRNWMLIHHTN